MEKRNVTTNSTTQARDFDWEYARQRIAEVRARLVMEEEQRPEVLQEVWAQHAAKEAARVNEESGADRIELIVVRLGQEFYGLDAQYVFRIDEVGHITEVPHVPAWVAGVTNVRGRILSAFDLRRFLGLAQGNGGNGNHTAEVADLPYLVLVETPEMELALLVQEVLTVTSIPIDLIQDTLDAIRGIPPEYVRGVIEDLTGNADLASIELDINATAGTPTTAGAPTTAGTPTTTGAPTAIDMLVVLDLQALLADERLVIQEEVA
jgi:purine-binding chemotaxis protein CheW